MRIQRFKEVTCSKASGSGTQGCQTQKCVLFPWCRARCPRVPSTVINAEDTECKIHVWEEFVLSSTGGLWERHGRPGEEPSLGGGGVEGVTLLF